MMQPIQVWLPYTIDPPSKELAVEKYKYPVGDQPLRSLHLHWLIILEFCEWMMEAFGIENLGSDRVQ